ncbi:FIST N-terminal domain-containing protein [Yoonia maritima]|uniref:FIST N-terminal domain-containing protein n=1 Tax=Yoonia maritima TaxID=1435347 RepID=UPI0037356CD4
MNIVDREAAGASIVSVGVSMSADPDTAVSEAVSQLPDQGICFILVFVPECLDTTGVAAALEKHLPQTLAFGCTTGGQITPQGYADNALMLVSFPRDHFRCSSTLFEPLKPVSIEQTALAAQTLAQRFQTTAGWRRFAITIADGLSKQEDTLVAALEAGLGDIPVFGGSAGHGLAFDVTYVLHGGAFHEDAALLLIVETDLLFEGVEFDHFMPTDRQLVVTAARPEDRIVSEINGAVAAEEYARLIGYEVADLSPRVFAENPVLVRNLDNWHVRAIQEVLDDGALTFLSAIENGLVLTLARGKEIIETMDAELTVTGPRGEAPHFVLGFDCVLRRLEIEQKQLGVEASEVLRKRKVLGFNTYGEQHGGVHVNQTFVGIAFFSSGHKIDL